MLPPQHFQALQKIITLLTGCPIHWAITGSVGMALQGVPVEVHDIDIQTDAKGAYEIERCLAEYVVCPVRYSEAERIRSHLGMFEVDGIKVEVMGNIQKCLGDQAWEEPVKVERHNQWIEIDEMRISVLSLEYEYQAYLKMGRTEKAALLRDWIQKTKGR